MRTPALLSMMVLATAPAALAETAPPTDSCVLKTPLKATRPGGVSKWETLSPGTELSMVSRKSDWSRVRQGDTIHIVATSQFNHACVAAAPAAPKTEPAKAETTTSTTAAAAPKTEPAKTETTTTTATEPAKAETTTTTAATEPAKTETKSTTAAAAAAAPAVDAKSETAKTETKTGPIAASATTKTETPDAKKLTTSPLPSQPSSGQLFVLGLLLLGAVFTGVFLRRRAVVEQNHLDVVATRTLGRGKQLVIVNAGDARLLLGVTDQGITLLSSTPSSESAAPRSSSSSSSRPKLSLLTEEEEAATSSPAASFFSGVGKKVGGLWGRPPAGPPADWDSFDRILASTVPDSSADDAPPSNSRRSSERASSGGGAADLAELARELQKHGVRRSA